MKCFSLQSQASMLVPIIAYFRTLRSAPIKTLQKQAPVFFAKLVFMQKDYRLEGYRISFNCFHFNRFSCLKYNRVERRWQEKAEKKTVKKRYGCSMTNFPCPPPPSSFQANNLLVISGGRTILEG